MEIGAVTADGNALVRLTVRGPEGQERELEAVIDTGFNGALTLPAAVSEALDLAQLGRMQVTLASGLQQSVRTWRATIRWADTLHSAVVIESAEPLIGMALLWGYELRLQCTEGGRVNLAKLAAGGGKGI